MLGWWLGFWNWGAAPATPDVFLSASVTAPIALLAGVAEPVQLSASWA
jgi:hypothetical protein